MAGKTILVIESGGCEDATCRKLAQSHKNDKIFLLSGRVFFGNHPKVELITGFSIDDHAAIVEFCKKNSVDIVFADSNNFCYDKLVGVLSEANVHCFGTSADVARLEVDLKSR